MNHVAYISRISFLHPRGWEMQSQGASRISFWQRPASRILGASPLPVSSHGRGKSKPCGDSCKDTDFIHVGSIFRTSSHPEDFPEIPPANTITWGCQLLACVSWEERNTLSMTHALAYTASNWKPAVKTMFGHQYSHCYSLQPKSETIQVFNIHLNVLKNIHMREY